MKYVKPFLNEDYNFHYQFNKQGKRILDLGADVGSTAFHFLENGALTITAVEASENLFKIMIQNIDNDKRVTPVLCNISSSKDLTNLLNGEEDFVKVDIEGAELFLIGVSDEVIKSKKDWCIEVHSKHIEIAIKCLFEKLGFKLYNQHVVGSAKMVVLYYTY